MHADSLTNVIKRLTSPPMNVSKVYIPLMNNALHIQRVELPKPRNGLNFGRRIRTIWEIEEYEQYREVAVWNPGTDTFECWFENSILLERISLITGKTREALLEELEIRRKFLLEMLEKGVRDQKEVAETILGFYSDKKEEHKSRRAKNKKQKKKKESTTIIEEGKEEDIPHLISREEIDTIFPEDTIQHESIEHGTLLNPLSEGEK